jgi:hypothetical protein
MSRTAEQERSLTPPNSSGSLRPRQGCDETIG